MIALLERGEAACIQRVREAGRVLGEVVADVVSILNPNTIVIGGTLSRAGEHLLSGVREMIYARSLPLALEGLTIYSARLDDRAGILGAAQLMIDAQLAEAPCQIPCRDCLRRKKAAAFANRKPLRCENRLPASPRSIHQRSGHRKRSRLRHSEQKSEGVSIHAHLCAARARLRYLAHPDRSAASICARRPASSIGAKANAMKLKLGTVQFHHRANDKAYNLSVVERFSREAAATGVKILAFPEMCVTGYWHARNLGRKELDALAEVVPDGDATRRMMALARELDMAIGVGLIERAPDGGLFNAYVLCQRDGSFA